MNKSKIFTGIFLYIISAVAAYFFFTRVYVVSNKIVSSPIPQPQTQGGVTVFDSSLPKTEPCPLNGVLYSKQQEAWWQKHRPLGIMVENSTDARPQSGLSGSDVIYEAEAEAGITRFMAVFYCQDAGEVGPVRSARTYFLDFISEYGAYPLYAHVGGANTSGPADALGQIVDYGWGSYNDLNQFSIGFPTFWRDYDRLGHTVATEHTMYTTTSKLWDFAAKNRGLTNVDKDGTPWDKGFVPYTFKSDADLSSRPQSQVISFDFTPGNDPYGVTWTYDRSSNTYLRDNGGQKHIDRDTGKQLTTKNIVMLYMTETHANDGYENNLHMLYGTTGSGKAIVFMDGKKINATWSKASRTSRLMLTNSSGEDISFDRGRIWFELVSPNVVASVE